MIDNVFSDFCAQIAKSTSFVLQPNLEYLGEIVTELKSNYVVEKYTDRIVRAGFFSFHHALFRTAVQPKLGSTVSMFSKNIQRRIGHAATFPNIVSIRWKKLFAEYMLFYSVDEILKKRYKTSNDPNKQLWVYILSGGVTSAAKEPLQLTICTAKHFLKGNLKNMGVQQYLKYQMRTMYQPNKYGGLVQSAVVACLCSYFRFWLTDLRKQNSSSGQIHQIDKNISLP